MTLSTFTPMRTVNGLIKVEEDIKETTVIPAGYYITMQEYASKYGIPYSTVRKKVSVGSIKSAYIDGKRMVKDERVRKD